MTERSGIRLCYQSIDSDAGTHSAIHTFFSQLPVQDNAPPTLRGDVQHRGVHET